MTSEAALSPDPVALLRRLVAVCDAASMVWTDPVPEDSMNALHDAKEYLAAAAPSLLQERDRLDVLLAAERLSISRAAHSTVKAINDAPGPLHDPRAHERTLEKMVARHEAEYARLSTQPSTLKPIEDEFDFTIERIGPAQGEER